MANAAGAFYLSIINTICIAFATLIGAMFIMKFRKKQYVDQVKELRVKRGVYAIAFVTIIPAVLLTIRLVNESYFEQRVTRFVHHELHFPMTQVISHDVDFEKREINVVLIGNEVDSASLKIARERLPLYKLDGASLNVIQGAQGAGIKAFNEKLLAGNKELHNAEAVIAQQHALINELEQKLQPYTKTGELAPQLLREVKVLYPHVESLSVSRGTTAVADSTMERMFIILSSETPISNLELENITKWFKERTGEDVVVKL